MPVLAIRTYADGLLSVLAPLGMGAAAGTALVLDLDPTGVPLPSPASVADLVEASPTLDQLRPARRGLAVLTSGGAGWTEAASVVEALGAGWPAVVVRVAAEVPLPTVPVVPLIPGLNPGVEPAVYQRTGIPGGVPGDGPVLPVPGSRVVRAALSGRMFGGRWVRAWRQAWRLAWT